MANSRGERQLWLRLVFSGCLNLESVQRSAIQRSISKRYLMLIGWIPRGGIRQRETCETSCGPMLMSKSSSDSICAHFRISSMHRSCTNLTKCFGSSSSMDTEQHQVRRRWSDRRLAREGFGEFAHDNHSLGSILWTISLVQLL